ncbi:glycosyltransferase [Caulobacter segnis]
MPHGAGKRRRLPRSRHHRDLRRRRFGGHAPAAGLAMVCAGGAPTSRGAAARGCTTAQAPARDQPNAYAEALAELVLDGDLRRRLELQGARAQRHLRRWTQILDEVIEVYAEALSAAPTGPPSAADTSSRASVRTAHRRAPRA